MRLINRIVNRWWWAVTVGCVAQGLAIYETYLERGKVAYGGEYLILPMVLTVALAVETGRGKKKRG